MQSEPQIDTSDVPISAPPVDDGASPSLEEVIADYEGEAVAAPAETEKPVSEVAPPVDPITHESVQSDKAPEESLPDSSLIADRLQRSANETAQARQHQEQAQELEADREELRQLRLLRRGEPVTPEPEPDKGDAQDERIRGLEARLEASDRAAKEQQDRAQMAEDSQAVVDWVTEQKEHFPMLNKLGHQALVYQKMRNERYRTGQYLSEAQSGREVEAEIVDIVHRCAPLLGYAKSQEATQSEETVSVGAPNMGISDPKELSYSDDDDADLDALVTEYEKNLR